MENLDETSHCTDTVSDEIDLIVPENLKESGRIAWKNNNVDEAIRYWQEGLQVCLKNSVKGICGKRLLDLQISIRLNLALALLHKNEWNRAISNCNIVLSCDPVNVKALYRKALAYDALQDFVNVEESCNKLLEIDENNREATALLKKIVKKKAENVKKEKKFFSNMLNRMITLQSNSEQLVTSLKKKDQNLIKIWEIDWDATDYDNQIWNEAKDVEALKKCNLTITRGFPLTIINALDRIYHLHYNIYNERQNKCRNQVIDINESSKFPEIVNCGVPDIKCGDALQCIYQGLPDLDKKNLVIHCIGPSIFEDTRCKFTTITSRIKSLSNLILVFVGSNDSKNTEFVESKLKSGSLSDPISTTTRLGQIVISVFYKGNYCNFVERYPGILDKKDHTFHPDICVLKSTNFGREEHLWEPTLKLLAESKILCIGVEDMESPDNSSVTEVTNKVGCKMILPCESNRFCTKYSIPKNEFRKDQDLMANNCKLAVNYTRNGVVCAFQGVA